MKRRSLFALLIALFISTEIGRAADALPAYLYVDFEPGSGWVEGAWTSDAHALRLMQGNAVVVRAEEPFGQVAELRASEPFAALAVEMAPLRRATTIHAEFWAQPPATAAERGAEFFDLGGAIVGFFRTNDREGEVFALHGGERGENVWISTGIRVPLDGEELAAEWLQFGVCLRRNEGRWDLLIGDTKVLAGLRTVSVPGNETMPCWFFGDTMRPLRLDGIFISSVATGTMEKLLAARTERMARRSAQASALRHPQIVTRKKPTADLRERRSPPATVGEAPRLRGWKITLETGGRTYRSPEPAPGKDPNAPGIIAYAPGYDEQGKPLPLKIRITADAELKPGVDLARLRWQLAELLGWPDKTGRVLQHGDFRTGLVQEVISPPEDARKATQVVIFVSP